MGAPVTTITERSRAAVSAGSGGDQDQAADACACPGMDWGSGTHALTCAAVYLETVTCRIERKNAAGPATSRCS